MSRAAGRWIASLAILFGLAAIVTVQLGPNRHRIEDDLTHRATAALATAGQTGAQVSFTGRDGLITVPEAVADQARSVVEAVPGVRAVDTRVIPAAVPPSTGAVAPRLLTSLAGQITATLDVVVLRARLAAVPPLRFETGGAGLTTASRAALGEVAALLADRPEARLRIDGHTDSRGSVETNLRLSRERAESVRTALRELGVDAGRMTTTGYGEARPAVPNDTAAHRAANRRVELSIR